MLLGFNKYFRSLIGVSRYSRFLASVCKYFRFLIDASGYFILVKFGGIFRLVKSGKFLRYRVDISRNCKLIDLSRFFLNFGLGLK